MEAKPLYRTAEELGISEEMRQGLIGVMRDLADGTIPPERFDMSNPCGTACCIHGHMQSRRIPLLFPGAYYRLCMPDGWLDRSFTPDQGARAILNFLMGAADPWLGVV